MDDPVQETARKPHGEHSTRLPTESACRKSETGVFVGAGRGRASTMPANVSTTEEVHATNVNPCPCPRARPGGGAVPRATAPGHVAAGRLSHQDGRSSGPRGAGRSRHGAMMAILAWTAMLISLGGCAGCPFHCLYFNGTVPPPPSGRSQPYCTGEHVYTSVRTDMLWTFAGEPTRNGNI